MRVFNPLLHLFVALLSMQGPATNVSPLYLPARSSQQMFPSSDPYLATSFRLVRI